MEIKEVKFRRFISSYGMCLKWGERYWDDIEGRWNIRFRFSAREALIDTENIVGSVKEISTEQYREETKGYVLTCGA